MQFIECIIYTKITEAQHFHINLRSYFMLYNLLCTVVAKFIGYFIVVCIA